MLISWGNSPWLYQLTTSSLAVAAVAVDCAAFCCLASCAVYCVLRLERWDCVLNACMLERQTTSPFSMPSVHDTLHTSLSELWIWQSVKIVRRKNSLYLTWLNSKTLKLRPMWLNVHVWAGLMRHSFILCLLLQFTQSLLVLYGTDSK